MIDLSVGEHLALCRSLTAVMAALEPWQLETALSESVDYAYEFQYSLYLREAAARLAGVMWLPVGEYGDEPGMVLSARPILDISFDRDGSLWRITARQLRFLKAIVDFHSGAAV